MTVQLSTLHDVNLNPCVQFNLGKIHVNLILLHTADPRTTFEGILYHGIILKSIKLTVHELRNALLLKVMFTAILSRYGARKQQHGH